MEYQKNNIIFRIASSDAIAKFKAKQAAALLQLTRKDLNFSGAPKEAVLLEYDMMSHWLYKVERSCLIAKSTDVVNDELLEDIVNSFDDVLSSIKSVMSSNSEIFDDITQDFTNIIHNYSIQMFRYFGDEHLHDNNSINVFIKVVSFISDYLEHVLVSMHDLTCNLEAKEIKSEKCQVLSNTYFCTLLSNEIDNCLPVKNRANFFKCRGHGDVYEFKNYTNQNLFERVRRCLSSDEINLLPEVNTLE